VNGPGSWPGSASCRIPRQLGRGEPRQVPLTHGDDPDQRQVLQEPPAQEGVACDRAFGGPVAAVLDHLTVDVLGAEERDKPGVGGRDQDSPPTRAAGAQDVVAQDIRVNHDRRRAQQDVPRERALRTGKRIGSTALILCTSATMPRRSPAESSGESSPYPMHLRLLKAAYAATG
jgi:hypothetical protein